MMDLFKTSGEKLSLVLKISCSAVVSGVGFRMERLSDEQIDSIAALFELGCLNVHLVLGLKYKPSSLPSGYTILK